MTLLEQPQYGRRVRELRDQRRITRKRLAEAVEIAPNYLTNITCGLEDPSNRVKYALAQELNAPELAPALAGIPDPPPKQPKRPKGPPDRKDKEKGPKRGLAS